MQDENSEVVSFSGLSSNYRGGNDVVLVYRLSGTPFSSIREGMKRYLIGILQFFFLLGLLFSQEEQYDFESDETEQDTIWFRQRENIGIRGGVTTGLNLSDMLIYADFPYKEADLERGAGFNVGIGMELLFFSRLSVNLRVMWTTYNASLWDFEIPDTALHEDDVVFNFSYMDLPLELKFYISGKRFTPFIFGGMRYGILVEQDIAAQSTIEAHSQTYTLGLDKLKRGYTGGIGFAFALTGGSEIQAEVGYSHHSGRNGTREVFSIGSYFLELSYFF